jgi:hypothetical protein
MLHANDAAAGTGNHRALNASVIIATSLHSVIRYRDCGSKQWHRRQLVLSEKEYRNR